MRLPLLSISLTLLAGSPVLASSSAWHEAEGVRLRLVTSGQADASGTLKGALQIDLHREWKTYWRDPGGSGVPPSIDISGSANIASLDIGYPAPTRFNDESGPWVGYKHSLALPVTFRLAAPTEPARIVAEVFIGVCETICIPVQARFEVDPASDPGNPEDAALVERAGAALPSAPQEDFGVELLSAGEDQLVVEAAFPGDAAAVDLFLAGTEGYSLGRPHKEIRDGKVTFAVPIIDRPAEKPVGAGLPYTLVTQAGAVAGSIPFP
ncbi:protein-disulfide reductase DsbD domain-containing protein [Arvimicrobium flavum]|uniref:protein-disulfide reductase DsbD domain-containing protein n=1 Tax=Arvimicrobium flavum TaxID=3393320 RepID=UPI00237BD467|nr:protein-disulfide reductase DsbD domain-containing protein [Mesorhizobium shangrilense]